MTTTVQAVLLDMGGVILQMQKAPGFPIGRFDWRGRQAVQRQLAAHGVRASAEELDRLLFSPWRRRYERRYERGREASWAPHLERLLRRYELELDGREILRAWFRPYGEQLRPTAGAAETLRELRGLGLRLALISNVPLPGAFYREVLERYDLAEPFDSMSFSYDAGSRKPSPAMLRKALAGLGLEAAESVMVGDRRRTDVAAGIAAGAVTVWLRGGERDGPRPDHEIDGLTELPSLIRSLGLPPGNAE